MGAAHRATGRPAARSGQLTGFGVARRPATAVVARCSTVPIPPPSVEPAESYSGKWQLRAPKSLHRRLAERAKREGVSLNALAVTLLAEGLGERAAHER